MVILSGIVNSNHTFIHKNHGHPGAVEVILTEMGKIEWYQTTKKMRQMFENVHTSWVLMQGPVSLKNFYHNSNVMDTSFYSHPNSNKVIAIKFCTCHDSCAVVPCAKFCCDLVTSDWITERRSFHRIWIVSKIPFVVQTCRHLAH